MKQYLLNLRILFVCISGTLLIPVNSFGQLSGNYTINPTKSASNTNYQNWASAIGDMISGSRTDGGTAQGSGVSGPVTFSVYDTLYNNVNIAITAISGASYTNTITFRSAKGDSSKCRLRYASSTSSTDDYVVLLDGADYITFRQIGFERTGTNTYSTVVQITNDADNNRFIRCLMKARKMPSNSSLGFAYGVGSCFYFTGNADSTQINSNRLLYGYNGIYCTSSCTAMNISNNLIDTSGSAGMYITNQTSMRITGNACNMGDFGTNQGHYTSYGMRIETSPGMEVSNNKISMLAVNCQIVRGMIIAGIPSSAAKPTMIYNNWIMNIGGTGNCTGLAVYACNYLCFYFNNVLILNSLADGSAYYHYPQYTNTYIKLLNNNFINKGGGYAINVSGSNTSDIDSVNFNNLYTTGSYLGIWNGTNYSSLSAWQSGSGKDANSISTDPGFSGNTNLHVSNIGLNGKALPAYGINKDIDVETRDASIPDIGADEFFPIANDAGVSNLDSPYVFCAGKQNVKVSFQNFGYDTIKSVQIQWQINGVSQTSYNWTGKVAPGQSSASLNLGSYTFSSNTAYQFNIWTRLPNNTSDGKNINDTLKITRLAGMSGSYTIGDTSIANYKSFNDAITAMTARGICGPIKFSVYKGIYKEQLTLVQLPGMKSANPISFENIGQDSSSILITLPSTAASGTNNATLQLRGADYVTFKGISFERTGVTAGYFGHVIHILNGSNYNTFSNCRMLGLPLTAANTGAITIWSDQSKDDHNSFINNYIKNGHYNMQYTATSGAHENGTLISGNTFEGGFKNAIQLGYNDSAVLKGNTFLNVNVAESGTSDIQLLDCDMNIRVDGNTFRDAVAESAIRLNGCNAGSSAPGIIANNMIIKSSGSGLQSNKGISLYASDYQTIAFNTVYFNGNAAANAGIYTDSVGASSNIAMRNNNIVMEGGEVIHINSGSHISVSTNNNYYNKGTQFAWWGKACNTFSDLATTSGKEQFSMSNDPLFISGTNLHIRNPLLKNAGIPVTGINTDIDGEVRNGSAPDIGADEFKLVPNDAGIVSLLKPVSNTCTGLISVEAVIKNIGGDTLKNASITWSVNGVAQTPKNWTGKLNTGSRDTFIVGSFNSTSILSAKFIIKSNLPNGQPDGILYNDSIIVTRSIAALPPANAGNDDTICLGDQIVLGPVNNNAYKYEWTTLSGGFIDSFPQITVKPTVKSSYVLAVTSKSFGCSRKDTVTISITTKPIADAGPDANVCYGSSFQLGKPAQAGFTYSWTSNPAGFTSTLANPVINPVTTTTYTVEKTSNFSGCKATDFAVITVVLPPSSLISGNSAVCNREKAIYTSKSNAGNTYLWSATGGVIEGGQGTNAVNILWNAAGSGSIRLIETNAFTCKDTVGYNVTVAPLPVAAFTDGAGCVGSNVPFTNQSTGATSYSWNFGDAGVSTQINPLHTYTSAGNYNVRLIAKSGNGCYDTIVKPQMVHPLPVAAYSIVRKLNRTIEFTDSSTIASGSIIAWDWDFGDGDTAMTRNPIHQYKSDASYTIKLCAASSAACVNCITKNYNILGVGTTGRIIPVSLFPNPGSGWFRIVSGEVINRVNVTSLPGINVATFLPDSKALEIDLSYLPAGIYMVNIQTAGGNEILKLIKE